MTHTPRVRRLATGAVLALSLGVLGACGSDDQADDASADSSDSSDTSETQPAAEEGEEVAADEFIDLYEAAFEKATTASISMSLEGAIGLSLEGQADFTTEPPAFAMTMDDGVSGEPLDLVLVDETIYIKSPQFGDKYLKTDPNDPDNPLGSGATDLADPRALLGDLEEGITSATYVGEEEVDGETFDHYSLVVDSQSLLDNFASGAENAPEIPEGILPDELTYDTYFDDEGFFRQLTVDLSDFGGVLEATFDDWGDPVDISAPPADQVEEFEFPTGGAPG